MYKELLTVPQTPEFTSRVLAVQVGDIQRHFIYTERFGNIGYIKDLETACGDALLQIKLLIEQLGYNLGKVEDTGRERFIERMKECEQGFQ